MMHSKIDGQVFYNMVLNANNRLEEQKDLVNSLNVFPVPDGDTGTNMSMTFRAAVMEIKNNKGDSLGEISKKLAKGALMGARGNSGVILSQILRGIAKGLEGKSEVDSKEFANAIMEGSKSAYKAVMRPTEGTILTVIRAAGESAVKSEAEDAASLMEDICEHSLHILNKTPEMLPVLKKAKVVDAGGKGLLILLEGMKEVLIENIDSVELIEVQAASNDSKINDFESEDIEFGYCTEFFVLSPNGNADTLKSKLEPVGDSLLVVSSDDLIKVHVHTNDPGFVLSEALKMGELSKIKIDNMREQHRSIIDKEEVQEIKEEKKYAFISVAMGKGISSIFEDLGVDCVIEGGQTMNPSTQDILSSIDKLNAECIFILPNNKNIIMAATQAAELSDKNVQVIHSTSIPQGITAVTAFSSELSTEENLDAMNEAISSVATGSITYAVRDTEIDGIAIKEGNILGLIESKIVEVGVDVYSVAENLIPKMVSENSELITIFYGSDCSEVEVEEFVSKLEDKYSDLDVQCYDGGQPLYYLLISVE